MYMLRHPDHHRHLSDTESMLRRYEFLVVLQYGYLYLHRGHCLCKATIVRSQSPCICNPAKIYWISFKVTSHCAVVPQSSQDCASTTFFITKTLFYDSSLF
jgi:hypothetical protein